MPAPEGTMVKDLPEHREPVVALTTGAVNTVTVTTAVLLLTQLAELVPVTE